MSARRSYGRLDSNRRSRESEVVQYPTLEPTMQVVAAESEVPISIRTDLCAIFVSLELSRSTWLVTSLSPGAGEKMSKHSVSASDTAGLLRRFSDLHQT